MTYANTSIEAILNDCKEKFNQIFSDVLMERNQDAHEVEASIFQKLIQLGFILMQLYFSNQNKGVYGETIDTVKGVAKRGRTSIKSYFSIFGNDLYPETE